MRTQVVSKGMVFIYPKKMLKPTSGPLKEVK